MLFRSGIRVLPAARRFLIEKGWDPKFGGRPLRRTLQKELEDPLSRMLLEHDWPFGTVFTAGCRGEGIRLSSKAPSEATSGTTSTGREEEEAVGQFEFAAQGS